MNDIFYGFVDYFVFVYLYLYFDIDCVFFFGILCGDVKDNQLIVLFIFSGEWLFKYVCFNGCKVWCGKLNDKSDKDEYLQIDFGKVWFVFINIFKVLMLFYVGGIYEEVFFFVVFLRRCFF